MRFLENLVMAVLNAALSVENTRRALRSSRIDDHYTAEMKALGRTLILSMAIAVLAGVGSLAAEHFLGVLATTFAPAKGLEPIQRGVSLIAGVTMMLSSISMGYCTYRLWRLERA